MKNTVWGGLTARVTFLGGFPYCARDFNSKNINHSAETVDFAVRPPGDYTALQVLTARKIQIHSIHCTLRRLNVPRRKEYQSGIRRSRHPESESESEFYATRCCSRIRSPQEVCIEILCECTWGSSGVRLGISADLIGDSPSY